MDSDGPDLRGPLGTGCEDRGRAPLGRERPRFLHRSDPQQHEFLVIVSRYWAAVAHTTALCFSAAMTGCAGDVPLSAAFYFWERLKGFRIVLEAAGDP